MNWDNSNPASNSDGVCLP